MKLNLEMVSNANQIQSYGDNHIVVRLKEQMGLCEYDSNIVLTADNVYHDIELDNLENISAESMNALKALDPEVIIFATGSGFFPPMQSLVNKFNKLAIGAEFMSLGSACRTYNLLINELRRVVLVKLN